MRPAVVLHLIAFWDERLEEIVVYRVLSIHGGTM